MRSTRHTGGLKEFRYTGHEELKDTKYTKAFKEDLRRRRQERDCRDRRDWYQRGGEISGSSYHITKKSKKKHWALALILFIVILASLYYFTYNPSNQLQPGNLTDITPVTGEIVDEVSLTKYFDDEYDGQYLTLIGHLQKDGVEYLVDNSGNKIKLITLRNPQKALFSTTKSVEVYGVRGILNKAGTNLSMQVRSLEKVVEDYAEKIVEEPEPMSIIEDKKKFIDAAKEKIDDWWKKMGERLDEALADNNIRSPEVKLSPENMKLVESSKCPEGQVRSWGECVSICDDRTHYGECSSTRPLYCYEGDLVPMPSRCGCPYDQDAVDNECLNKNRAIEKLILKHTNEERVVHGLSALSWDSSLSNIAREHSTDMANNDFFDHVNLREEDPSDRAQRNGYSIMKSYGGGYRVGIAENIGMMPAGNVVGMGYVGSDADSIAKAQVHSWMDSPGHRANILDSSYEKLGVGVDYDNPYYISTQDFW